MAPVREQPDGGEVLRTLRRYKLRIAVVTAFGALPDVPLVVAGDGPQLVSLRRCATSNVTFTGRVGDAELRWLYGSSSMLVAASHEDFGLTPLEAAAFGVPAAVLRAGGYLDTVIDGVNGRFFDAVDPDAIAATVTSLLASPPARARASASRFTESSFIARLQEVIDPEEASSELVGGAAT